MSRAVLAVSLLVFALGIATMATTIYSYVPVKCLNQFVIHDWGKCEMKGNLTHCPHADVTFSAACVALKPAHNIDDIHVDYPSAVLIDKQGAQPQK